MCRFSAFSFALTFFFAASASATTLRYAIVIGNNAGNDARVGTLPTLRHAEDEARQLHQRLLERCNFDEPAERTILLTRPTKTELSNAVRRIVLRIAEDRRAFGDADVFFGFFYTGHGLEGRVLLADGALDRDALAEVFRTVDADFSVGMFDACFSGSLSREVLVAKGVRPTPGLNLVQELPEQVLTAEGSVWLVSSAPDQLSYEDTALGGVFTHFFTEALDRAEPDGPGITLQRIWEYAQNKTVDYTLRRGRVQTPQQIVSKMKSMGPLFFSFQGERDAELVFGPKVHGSFVLNYANGRLSEFVEKSEGTTKRMAVYPGRLQLVSMREGRPALSKDLMLDSRSRYFVGVADGEGPSLLVDEQLWSKGGDGQELRMGGDPRSSRMTSASAAYEHDVVRDLVLWPRHWISAGLRESFEFIEFEGRVRWGFDDEEPGAWGYVLHSVGGELRVGGSLDIDDVRLCARPSFAIGRHFQTFRNGDTRGEFYIEPSLVLGADVALPHGFTLDILARAGVVRTPGVGVASSPVWIPVVGFGAGVSFRAR